MSTTRQALLNTFGATLRGWRGSRAQAVGGDPPQRLLKLYDIEASPYCRLVREVLTEADLDVLILPCPVGGRRFRLEAQDVGGKQQFPLLVDDNTETVLYESADIIDYLRDTYRGRGPVPRGLSRRLAVASSFASSASLLWRGGIAGLRVKPSTPPDQPLELFSFESSPYSKIVRARLCELELPYLLRNTGKGGWKDYGPPVFRDRIFNGEKGSTRNRRWLAAATGRVQVPYLIDPNTASAMYESAAILRYLDRTYGA